MRLLQYPALVEPLVTGAAPATPTFAEATLPEPVRRRGQAPVGGATDPFAVAGLTSIGGWGQTGVGQVLVDRVVLFPTNSSQGIYPIPAFGDFGWPTQPVDQAPRRRRPPTATGYAFDPAPRPNAQIGWDPQPLDQAPRRRRSLTPQGYTLDVDPRPAAQIGWAMPQPDLMRARRPSWAHGLSEPLVPLVTLDIWGWESTAPTLLPRIRWRPTAPSSVVPLGFTPAAPAPDAFFPVYPDRLARARPSWGHPLSESLVPIIQLDVWGWTPVVPDWLPRRVPQPTVPRFVETAVLPLVPNSWSATYPDWVARRRMEAAAQLAYAAPTQTLGDLFLHWQGEQPTGPWVRRLPTAATQTVASVTAPIPYVASPVDWWGVYPERVPTRVLSTAARWFWDGSFVLPTPPPDFAGSSFSSTWIEPRRLRPGQYPAFTGQHLYQPVPYTVGLVDWLGRHPDRLARLVRTITRWEVTTAADVERAISPVVWWPRHPDRLARRPIGWRPAFFEGVPGQRTEVARLGAWRPQAPILMRRRRPLVGTAGDRIWTIPAIADVVADTRCYELLEEGLTVTASMTDGFTGTALLDETFTTATLTDEAVC